MALPFVDQHGRLVDVFGKRVVTQVLKKKFIVVIGDSNQRSIYKDLVLKLQDDRLLTYDELRSKGEPSFLGDELIEGGKMTNGIDYKEVRQYRGDDHCIRFYFMTRCYNSYLETILKDLKEGQMPDVVIMNSCLWDISRYGPNSVRDYEKNLTKLFNRFHQWLPRESLLIWTTTLPISNSARGGVMVPKIVMTPAELNCWIFQMNFLAKCLVAEHGFHLLDLHFFLSRFLGWRLNDGIHWSMAAHRYITNLLLSLVVRTRAAVGGPLRGFGGFNEELHHFRYGSNVQNNWNGPHHLFYRPGSNWASNVGWNRPMDGGYGASGGMSLSSPTNNLYRHTNPWGPVLTDQVHRDFSNCDYLSTFVILVMLLKSRHV